MSGNTWGESWGILGSFAWGDSWGFEGFSPPVVVTPTPTATSPGGVGRAAWRDHYQRDKLPKSKRRLVDELDDMIAELRERISESPTADDGAYERRLRVSEALSGSQQLDKIADARIRAQIDVLKRAIEEIDDEEVLLLALH